MVPVMLMQRPRKICFMGFSFLGLRMRGRDGAGFFGVGLWEDLEVEVTERAGLEGAILRVGGAIEMDC